MRLLEIEHRGDRPETRQKTLVNPAQIVAVYDPGHSGTHIALADGRALSEVKMSVDDMRQRLEQSETA